MTEHEHNRQDPWIERRLRKVASQLVYPEAPDVPLQNPAGGRHALRRAWAATAAVVFFGLALVMTIPPVRSAAVDWVRAGVVVIYELATGEKADLPDPLPAETALMRAAVPMSLEEAQGAVPFRLRIPTWPDLLGLPDTTYVHADGRDHTVIMIWRNHSELDPLALFQIQGQSLWRKTAESIVETEVAGEPAFFVQAPHFLRLEDGTWESWSLVDRPVLIWTSPDGITYRLEAGLDLEQALRMAESLRPYDPMED